ncbi:MAG: NAD-dependent epimerase/dehydratase family protein, partial [Bdellovibrionales bacterium]|nr:NAD-dependent epimerase/dehydratase family protein [Bdellovibrionales bacterium]
MKTNKVKTLILGGYGYVGSQIDGDLRIGRNEVDLCKKNETYRFIKKIRPEQVIHSAPRGLFTNSKDTSKTQSLLQELQIHCNVINACLKNNVKKLLAISSIS